MPLSLAFMLTLSFTAPQNSDEPSQPVDGPPCPGCVVCGVPGGYCKSPTETCCGGGSPGMGKCFTQGQALQCCWDSSPTKLCGAFETCCSLGAGTTECCKQNQTCSFGSCIPP